MSENNSVLNFVDAVRTMQEAYGIMAEKFRAIQVCTDTVKHAVKDALDTLTEDDREAFVSTGDRAYSAAIQTTGAALNMAVAMQNGASACRLCGTGGRLHAAGIHCGGQREQ